MVDEKVDVRIDAEPQRVWDLITDVTRMGEWSPVCHRCEWLGASAEPVVGARFVGYNRQSGMRWSRECVVTAAERGREFAFSTYFKGAEATRWRYTFEGDGTGTTVTETYEIVSVPRWFAAMTKLPAMRAKSRRDTRRGMVTTLTRLKAAVESDERTPARS